MVSPKKQQVEPWNYTVYHPCVPYFEMLSLTIHQKLSGFSWHLWYIFTFPPGIPPFFHTNSFVLIQMVGWKIRTSRFFHLKSTCDLYKHDTTRTQFFQNILVCEPKTQACKKHPPPTTKLSCYLLTSKIPAHKINGAGIKSITNLLQKSTIQIFQR